MFLEPRLEKTESQNRAGWIEVICGSMFSGKTEELIRRLNRSILARQHVEIFKPTIDTRYHEKNVVSHNESEIRCTPVQFAEDIILLSGDCDVVGIDEGQFFDEDLVHVCMRLANNGKRVIIAGLDMDYRAQPFGPIPQLMSIAEYVTKVHAICIQCGNLASYTYRTAVNSERVLVGEKDMYEARCRRCFNDGNNAQ